MKESITMIGKEVDRQEVIRQGIGNRRRKEAGGQLGSSVRQIKRPVRRYRPESASGPRGQVAWMKRSEIRGWRAALSRISAFGLHPGYI
ncbi:hypothetical protein BMS3Bbin12_01848 [bacterium BMS3Bbin12]|nr:hypothetical protein BMS3Abin12_00771 [bacterium BMS3Abin12]GBE48667.1 hypothetical protein BMS3Bbin12_01848 [bacterium BMS3Bbin12]GBE49357.1 hypothetical protein BMS3Bbin13_00276 [bacterium BMS3Bbin13]HDK03572.1 hypothetical protein [Gammaproteobacteria bacterium]